MSQRDKSNNGLASGDLTPPQFSGAHCPFTTLPSSPSFPLTCIFFPFRLSLIFWEPSHLLLPNGKLQCFEFFQSVPYSIWFWRSLLQRILWIYHTSPNAEKTHHQQVDQNRRAGSHYCDRCCSRWWCSWLSQKQQNQQRQWWQWKCRRLGSCS